MDDYCAKTYGYGHFEWILQAFRLSLKRKKREASYISYLDLILETPSNYLF
jgi:hypothetical protein